MSSIGNPYYPVHPGDLIKDELEVRGISQRKLSAQIGVSYAVISETLNGKRPVTVDFALLLEAALGVSAGLLVRMQTSYNLQVAQSNQNLRVRLNEVRRVVSAPIFEKSFV
jgi:addiction module HigA family antidote